MTKFAGDPGLHPQALEFTDPKNSYHARLVLLMKAANPDTQTRISPAWWRAMNDETRDMMSGVVEQAIAGSHPKQMTMDRNTRRQSQTIARKHGQKLAAAHAEVERTLADIERQPPTLRDERMQALWENAIEHRFELIGEVAGDSITAPNLKAASSPLQKASSEPTVLKLEAAFERGRFANTGYSDYPMADISGDIGNAQVTAHAELLPLPTEAGAGGRKLMLELADKLRDPRLGLGPRVQQTVQALMSLWLTRQGRRGYVTVTISQLAEALGFAKGAHGYAADSYEQIREYVAVAARANLQVANMPSGKGSKEPQGRFEGLAYSISYADEGGTSARPSKGWTSLIFRPGPFLEAAASRDQALLMGADPELNKLNPRNERAELLLAKYLERHWRFNWNSAPGVIIRTVRELLTEGMDMPEAKADRPTLQTLDRLEAALEKLEDRKTVRGFEMSDAVTAVREQLQDGKRRMTPNMWQAVLAATVSIESGKAYHAHYKNHGLAWDGAQDRDPLVAELHELLQTTDRKQAGLAAEIGISPAQLSRILKGTRKVPPDLRERIDRVLMTTRTLQLPFE